MNKLFRKLSDQFNQHSGALEEYIDTSGADVAPRQHYDIRAFYSDDLTVPRTMRDMDYWNVTFIEGTEMSVLDSPRIITGRSVAARQVGTINDLTNLELDQMSMADLDLYTLEGGNEGWPLNDPDVVVGKDATERYANTIQVTLTDGVDKTVSSSVPDNIIADFDRAGIDYFIELALPDFPAQAATPRLDLANSWIDFSSSSTYAAGQTNSFRFSDSLNDLTAGGNTYWRINRNQLTNVDLSNLRGVRFRLRSVGNMTFKAMAMRLLPQDYTFDMIDIDTRRGHLRRSVPRDSGAEPATSSTGLRFYSTTRPKNGKMVARFNSGNRPTSPNNNELQLSMRHDVVENDRVIAWIKSNTTNTTIELRKIRAGVSTLVYTATGTLANETDYFFSFEVYEDKFRAQIHKSHGSFFGDLVIDTGWQTIDYIARGFMGWQFQPYNYDFVVDYITVGDVEFGRFESTPFKSINPVKGVTIASNESLRFDLSEGLYVESGDAIVTDDLFFGNPGASKKFIRSGLNWQGGYMTNDFIYIGNPRYLRVSGNIFPLLATGQTALRGQYRVVLLDKNDSVAYIGKIRNLLPSQWNDFDIHINADFAPGFYRLMVQQTGFFADTFWIDNLKLEHLSIAWEILPGGTTWYPAMFAKDKLHSSVNFIPVASNQIKVRAIALSDDAWISDYEVVPHYGYPGRVT